MENFFKHFEIVGFFNSASSREHQRTIISLRDKAQGHKQKNCSKASHHSPNINSTNLIFLPIGSTQEQPIGSKAVLLTHIPVSTQGQLVKTSS